MSFVLDLDYCTTDKPIAVLSDGRHCEFETKKIDIVPILNSLELFILNILNSINNNNIITEKKWDIYEHFGIEQFSYINRNFFKEFIYRLTSLYSLKHALLNMNSQHWYRTTENHYEYIYMYINNPIKNYYLSLGNENDYKIHLMVKPEYAIYAFYKLLYIRNLKLSRIKRIFSIQCKLMLQGRMNVPKLHDTSLINDSGNGGASPTIVIYSNDSKEDTKELILFLFKLFETEFDEIGLMIDVFEKPHLIPTFNVRLNPLMSYTTGNRTTKLDLRIKEDANGRFYEDRYYKVPNWVKNEAEKCTPETKDEINRRAQEWFGYNLCSEDGHQNIDMRFFNYLSIHNIDMLSPSEIYEPERMPIIRPSLIRHSSEYLVFNDIKGGRKKTTKVNKSTKKSAKKSTKKLLKKSKKSS